MNIEDKEIKDPFFDKRDELLPKITSSTYFYEVFAKKKIKCDVKIPQTILCEAGKLLDKYNPFHINLSFLNI